MGRSKLTTSLKSNIPIPIPHDGPVFRFLLQKEGKESKNNNGIIQESIILASQVCNCCCHDDNDDDAAAVRIEIRNQLIYSLIKSLKGSKSSKEQIQALQVYRSKFLNNMVEWSKQVEDGNELQYHNNNNTDAERGLYRLLLEWSLSGQTPVPLTRAAQSILTVMFRDSTTDDATATTTTTAAIDISKQVIESFFFSNAAAADDDDDSSEWNDALFSLEVAINYKPLLKILMEEQELFNKCLTFLHDEYVSLYLKTNNNNTVASSSSSDSLVLAQQGIRIAEILKILLNNSNSSTSIHEQRLKIPYQEEFQNFILLLFVCPAVPDTGYNTLGIVYGRLLLLVPPQMDGNNSKNKKSPSEIAVENIETFDVVHSNLPSLARIQILSGIAAALTAEALVESSSNTTQSPLGCCWRYLLRVGKTASDPLVRWAALKGLSSLTNRWKTLKKDNNKGGDIYRDLIDDTLGVVLQAWENPPLRKLGAAIPGLFETLVQLLDKEDVTKLLATIMKQPVNRKGRYLALDILLPYMQADTKGQTIQAESLLEGIGDRGPNTGPIADLWTKLLIHLWGQINDKSSPPSEQGDVYYEEWQALWIPSLCRALVVQNLSRRKQIAAFCVPRIADVMKKSKVLKPYLSSVFVDILKGISNVRDSTRNEQGAVDFTESIDDRVLWAQLEIARQSVVRKLLTEEVRKAIASHLPEGRIRVALTHGIPAIRLVAFQSLHAVAASHGKGIEGEADWWQYAFPFAAKTTEKGEYTSTMLQSLCSFLDRLSLSQVQGDIKRTSNAFYQFCVDFLLNEMIVKRGAYPGTVANKEGFTLSLMGCILSFVTQDQSYSIATIIIKNGVVLTRKRSANEQETMGKILDAMLHCEIFAALFSLLFSIWDNTRSLAFGFLSKLVLAGQSRNIALPVEFCSEEARQTLHARGVYLASSPRQREADTGARILTFLYMSLTEEGARKHYFQRLLDLLKSRLSAMKGELRTILAGESDGTGVQRAGDLPLAHGIIFTLSLCIRHQKLEKKLVAKTATSLYADLYDQLAEILCEAIQVSLAVVADVREGESIEGLSDDMNIGDGNKSRKDNCSSVPLNVNTGAIGANGTFSSVASSNEQELKGRLAVQRVVIGSWLLTKETCAALATISSLDSYKVSFQAFEKIGALLISTLTTLKHAGAAFAARDSLQAVVASCLSSKDDKIRCLPERWAARLIEEISISEKVRDSTLRRSTGYALGFLAIMRSEIASKKGPNLICSRVLERLLTFSLPPEEIVKREFEKLELNNADDSISSFFLESLGQKRSFVRNEDYEGRCRVHAFNVIRLIILDAPLSSEVQPFVGEAIISAILGYNDPSWAVRNSATMVFAAAMLRVVDADKNASNSDRTSSNAITITELFHRYPSLSPFLLAVMSTCVKDISGIGVPNSQIFPILLLLSRIHPIATSGETAAELTKSFIPIVLKCLKSQHHSIRAAAGRSLANLCPDVSLVADKCHALLNENLNSKRRDWNEIDGLLLSFEALSRAFPSFAKYSRDIESTLLQLVSLDASIKFPPSCMTTAIKTLITIAEHRPNKFSQSIMNTCQGVITCQKFTNVIGGADFYAVTSSAFVHIIQQSIWEPEHQTSLETSLQHLVSAFTSNIIDVRLAAAKSFKKSIYKSIDDLLALDSVDTLSKIGILSSVAKAILQSLHTELARKENIGAHPPTVRRLSRCLLECFYGYKAVVESVDSSMPSFLSVSDLDVLWSVSIEVIEKESLLLDGQDECNGETLLSSNAVEMAAIVIANGLKGNIKIDSSLLHDYTNTFVQIISRLNTPQASWRSRHSAAMAIKTSKILELPESDLGNLVDIQQEVLFEILGMLQDFDPDVQATAAQAACQYRRPISGSYDLNPHQQLPELILQDTFPKVYRAESTNSKESIIGGLITRIIDNCAEIDDAMIKFQEDSSQSLGQDASLLNATSSLRKIFEDEESNPLNEKILASQLAAQSLLAIDTSTHSVVIKEEIFERCSKCLSLVEKNTNNGGGIAHEMTRSPSIFSSLHSLIIVVAVALYLNINDDKYNNKETAQRIVAMVKEEDSSCIHPEIVTLLECLSQAKSNCTETKEAILKSCFLIENNVDG